MKKLISSYSANGTNIVGNATGKCIIAYVWGFDWDKEIVYIQMFSLDAKEAINRDWSYEGGIPQGGEVLPEHAKILFPILFPAFNWLKVEIFRHGITQIPEG